MINDFIRTRRFCKLIYLEILVNAWSLWLFLEQILDICSLNVRPLSILTPHRSIQLECGGTFRPLEYFALGGIGTYWIQKIRLGKSSQCTKILNYIKTSCIIFCTKMSRCFYIVYYWRVLIALLSKNGFFFFFIIFWPANIPPSFQILHYWLIILHLSALHFSHLLHQAKSLTILFTYIQDLQAQIFLINYLLQIC